jgi:hypothetical protein
MLDHERSVEPLVCAEAESVGAKSATTASAAQIFRFMIVKVSLPREATRESAVKTLRRERSNSFPSIVNTPANSFAEIEASSFCDNRGLSDQGVRVVDGSSARASPDLAMKQERALFHFSLWATKRGSRSESPQPTQGVPFGTKKGLKVSSRRSRRPNSPEKSEFQARWQPLFRVEKAMHPKRKLSAGIKAKPESGRQLALGLKKQGYGF